MAISQTQEATYTTQQTDQVLVSASEKVRLYVTGVAITAHDNMTAKPSVTVKLGTQVVAKHPGVPAGGGLVATGMDVAGAQGDDITVTCDNPTGGSVSVIVYYYVP